jgi:hypothetical protein
MSPQSVIRTLAVVVAAAAIVGCGTAAPPAPAAGDSDSVAVAAPAPATEPEVMQPARPVAVPAPAPEPRRQARPAPQPPVPAPPPPPEPVTVVIPAGTVLDVAFIDSVSSVESQPGDPVRVRVVSDIIQNDIAAIPAGSVVSGTVTEAKSLKKIGGRALVGVEFTTLELTSGRTAAIHTTFSERGKSETKKDAATIGGATAGGALLGRIIKDDDKSKGTLIGAVVGAAAGTAIAAKTEGEEVLITSGTRVNLELLEQATVTIIP